jgi:hypothetical protein
MLRPLMASGRCRIAAALRQRLRTLFDDYLSAKDAAAEKALVDAVAEIDKNYYDRTRERIDGIAEKVKGILTAGQLAALSKRFAPRQN